MQISSKGIDLIKHHEGLRTRAYRDAVGVWTIGYGHTANVTNGQTISTHLAETYLLSDLRSAEAEVSSRVTVPLTQGQFDALVSFVFNLGAQRFRTSTLLRELNKGHYDKVPAELMRWTKGNVNGKMVELPGLVSRRRDEAALWRSLPILAAATPAAPTGGRAAGPPVATPTPVAPAVPAATGAAGTVVLAGELYKQFSDAATQAQPFLSLGNVGIAISIALIIGAGLVIYTRIRNRNS